MSSPALARLRREFSPRVHVQVVRVGIFARFVRPVVGHARDEPPPGRQHARELAERRTRIGQVLKGLEADHNVHARVRQVGESLRIAGTELGSRAAVQGRRVRDAPCVHIDPDDLCRAAVVGKDVRPVPEPARHIDHGVALPHKPGREHVPRHVRIGPAPRLAQHVHVELLFRRQPLQRPLFPRGQGHWLQDQRHAVGLCIQIVVRHGEHCPGVRAEPGLKAPFLPPLARTGCPVQRPLVRRERGHPQNHSRRCGTRDRCDGVWNVGFVQVVQNIDTKDRVRASRAKRPHVPHFDHSAQAPRSAFHGNAGDVHSVHRAAACPQFPQQQPLAAAHIQARTDAAAGEHRVRQRPGAVGVLRRRRGPPAPVLIEDRPSRRHGPSSSGRTPHRRSARPCAR